jgi:uncharacterized membrane protein YgdD (TMEM256/DUF423 family)
MLPAARRASVFAALSLAIATLVGAAAAHLLKRRFDAERYEVLQTAVQYQLFHSLGLLALAQLLDRLALALLRVAAWMLSVGIVLFSGSLYLLIAGAPAIIGIATPVGGLALIAAWALAALALLRAPR